MSAAAVADCKADSYPKYLYRLIEADWVCSSCGTVVMTERDAQQYASAEALEFAVRNNHRNAVLAAQAERDAQKA